MAKNTLLSLFIVISVFHFLWFLIGTGCQSCIKTTGTQKNKCLSIAFILQNICVFLSACQSHYSLTFPLVDLRNEWLALLKLGPRSGDTIWLHTQGHWSSVALRWLSFPVGSFDIDRSSQRSMKVATGKLKVGWWSINSKKICEQKRSYLGYSS